MATIIIEEVKHTLVQVIDRTRSTRETVIMLHKFLEALDEKLRNKGYQPFFRTHQTGVSGFCNPRKAFLFFNLAENSFSIKFWTGNRSIIGLKKANWLNKADNLGSETFRVDDSDTAEQALEYAYQAFLIASEG